MGTHPPYEEEKPISQGGEELDVRMNVCYEAKVWLRFRSGLGGHVLLISESLNYGGTFRLTCMQIQHGMHHVQQICVCVGEFAGDKKKDKERREAIERLHVCVHV